LLEAQVSSHGIQDTSNSPVFRAFHSPHHNVSKDTFQAWWDKKKVVLGLAGIPEEILANSSLKSLRAGCITDMHNANVRLDLCMRMARHVTPAVNLGYNQANAKEAALKVDSIMQC